MSGKSYICCCGFQSTRATDFLKHLRQEGSSGTGLHRMLVSHEEPGGLTTDITNDFIPSVNPLWSPSPERRSNTGKAYDSDSPVTMPPGPQIRPGAHAAEISNGAPGAVHDLSLLQQSTHRARSAHPAADQAAHHESTHKQMPDHSYQTRQWSNKQDMAPEAAAASGYRHKHARDKSRGESQPASKRRVTAEICNDGQAVQQHAGSGTGSHRDMPAGPEELRAGMPQPRSDQNDGFSDAAAPHLAHHDATDYHEAESWHRHVRRQALHSTASPQGNTSSNPGQGSRPQQLGGNPPDSERGIPGLPVSQPAVGASAVQHARDRARGVVACQSPASSDVQALPQVLPYAAHAPEHLLDDFWPAAFDAGSLVAWVEELVSWRNPGHSRHALLLLLYGMYVMKRLMQQVSFAPMSVVSTVALAAVVRHGMAATLPTIREQARTFQQQAQGQKDRDERSARATAEAGLQAVAAIACHVYDTLEATVRSRPLGQLAVEWGGGMGGDGHSAGRGHFLHQTPRLEAIEIAKAAFVLIHRATACKTASGSCMTAAVLWALLLLSEAFAGSG